jgi:hypothetical protein
MKLRIRGNSIRLRLTRPEVELLAATGRIVESTRFPGSGRLTYAIEVASSISEPSAEFDGARICVRVPRAFAETWPTSVETGLLSQQSLPDGGTLRILIERDFECLSPRADESQEGAYANPAHQGVCTHETTR